MDLRKKTNPFVENAKASEFRRAAARRQQQMTSRKTSAQRFKERYGRGFKEKYGIKGYIK